MVIRVHNNTADGRSDTHVTLTACFTDGNVFVVDVTNLADCSHAVDANHSNFARGETYLCVLAFLRHQLCAVTCASYELTALTGRKLNVVNQGTNRDGADRKCITGLNISRCTGDNYIAVGKTKRCNDVALFAVFILEKSDVCASVRIVFDTDNCCRHIHLVTLKVDYSVFLSVSAATMPNGNSTVGVSAGMLL